MSFSPDEDALVYTAEAKVEDDKDADTLDSHYFVPPLGEGYPNKKRPALYLFGWSVDKAFVKALRQSETSAAPVLLTQPVFATADQIIAIGYPYTADFKLLGIKWCFNRFAGVYSLTLPAHAHDDSKNDIQCTTSSSWTPSTLSCRCPRIIKREGVPSTLAYISNLVGGPHASCASLHVVSLNGEEQDNLAVVQDPGPDEFPGLFAATIPDKPLLSIGPCFALTTIWRSRQSVILYSNGKVVNLTPDDGLSSWIVLGTDGVDQLVCSRSSLTSPPELLLGTVTSSLEVTWRRLSESSLPKESERQHV